MESGDFTLSLQLCCQHLQTLVTVPKAVPARKSAWTLQSRIPEQALYKSTRPVLAIPLLNLLRNANVFQWFSAISAVEEPPLEWDLDVLWMAFPLAVKGAQLR